MPSRTLLPRRHKVCDWKEYFGKLLGVGGMTSLFPRGMGYCSHNNRYFLICLLKRKNPLNCKGFLLLRRVCETGARTELLRAAEAEGSDQ